MNTNLTRRSSQQPFQNFIEQFFDDSFFNPSLVRRNDDERSWFPSVDLSQTPERFLVRIDLPGMGKEDIDLTVENQTLTISGERRFENGNDSETFNRIERAYGKFSRSFQLPANVDSSNVSASFRDGVLHVEIPKSEEAKSRKIDIS